MILPFASSRFESSLLPWALLTLTLAGLCSCGSSGGESEGAQVDLLITDAPFDSVVAFRATLETLALERDDERLTPNLLAAPIAFDLAGLQGIARWLGRTRVEPGTYRGMVLRFDPDSFDVITKVGERYPINVAEEEAWKLVFDEPLVLARGTYRRVLADIDLREALTEIREGAPWELSAAGRASLVPIGQSLEVETVEGLSVINAEESPLGVRVVVNENPANSRGGLPVDFESNAVFIDEDGSFFGSFDEFRQELRQDISRIQVRGALSGEGILVGSLAELLDQSQGRDSRDLVEIEGQVLDLSPLDAIELLIREVRRGERKANDVLDRLGDPVSITFDLGDAVILDDENRILTPRDLEVGQILKVRFHRFETAERVASRVTLEDGSPRVGALVVDVAGLPGSMVVHVNEDEPWVRSGAIESGETPVVVDISAVIPLVDLDIPVEVTVERIRVGSRVVLRGELEGPAEAPTVIASSFGLKPGIVEGTVQQVFPGSRSFTVRTCRVRDRFAEDLPGSEFEVVILDQTSFFGDVADESEFFETFLGLTLDERMTVSLSGLLGTRDDTVDAFRIVANKRDKWQEPIELWPPNHRLIDICLGDLLDIPEGARLRIDGVTQDEPVLGRGSGKTSPDAYFEEDGLVAIRAEREGGGNGRVYQIAYTIIIDEDTSEEGTWIVTVPKDQRGRPAEDDGQAFDSTESE